MIKYYLQHKAQRTQSEGEKKIADLQIAGQERALEAAKKVQPAEARAMAQLRKASEKGTMDVEALNMQRSQPLYQQGQAQVGQQLGQLTRQGLEGSVIAQEVSRKVGADVRADIASQARQIALQNQQTKAGAQQRLQGALFKRGELLRNLAQQKAGLSTASQIAATKQDYANKLGNIQVGQSMYGDAEDAMRMIMGAPPSGGSSSGGTTGGTTGGGFSGTTGSGAGGGY